MIALGDCGRGDPHTEKDVFSLMDAYWDLGGRTFDAALIHREGRSDEALGRWLASRKARDQACVVTKGSFPVVNEMSRSRLSPSEIMGDLESSLRLMKTDYSDFHLLHRDDPKIPVEEVMPTLDRIVRQGKAKAVGVSNWSVGRIAQANEFAMKNSLTPLKLSEIRFGLAVTTPPVAGDVTSVQMNDVEFAWYRETQFPLLCFGAQACGWFASLLRGEVPKPKAQKLFDVFPENRRRLSRLKTLSDKLALPASAITTSYVLSVGLNAQALCAYSTREQMQESFLALARPLSAQEVRYLQTGESPMEWERSY